MFDMVFCWFICLLKILRMIVGKKEVVVSLKARAIIVVMKLGGCILKYLAIIIVNMVLIWVERSLFFLEIFGLICILIRLWVIEVEIMSSKFVVVGSVVVRLLVVIRVIIYVGRFVILGFVSIIILWLIFNLLVVVLVMYWMVLLLFLLLKIMSLVCFYLLNYFGILVYGWLFIVLIRLVWVKVVIVGVVV